MRSFRDPTGTISRQGVNETVYPELESLVSQHFSVEIKKKLFVRFSGIKPYLQQFINRASLVKIFKLNQKTVSGGPDVCFLIIRELSKIVVYELAFIGPVFYLIRIFQYFWQFDKKFENRVKYP